MSAFMMILGGADLDNRSGNPDVAPVMLTRYMEWVGELQRNGVLTCRISSDQSLLENGAD